MLEKFPQFDLRMKRNFDPESAFSAIHDNEDLVVCLMAKYDNVDSGKWFVGFACSSHMTHNKSLFSSYTKSSYSPVEFRDSNTTMVAGKGIIAILILLNGKQISFKLPSVLHVPEIG